MVGMIYRQDVDGWNKSRHDGSEFIRLNDVLVEVTRPQITNTQIANRTASARITSIALSPRSRASARFGRQSVSRGVAMTLSLSAHRRVNSCCSRSASSSSPIQRNLRMRLTRSFALLSLSAISSGFGCLSGIGIIFLPSSF
jgi:hypothetical protein